MSWETFKQNILRVANNPDGIPNIETIADLYATEYDAAIKRGFDTTHRTKVRSGDVQTMKQFFLSALQKGLTSSSPYDLVGEMGAGVKAYWATAILGNDIIPTIPAPGTTSNIAVISNNVTNAGVWQPPIGGGNTFNSELTPEQRVEFQEKLEQAVQRYDELKAPEPLKAETYLDEINKFTGILEANENTRVPVPTPAPPIPPSPSPSTPPASIPVPAGPPAQNVGPNLGEFEDAPEPDPFNPPTSPTINPNVENGPATSGTLIELDELGPVRVSNTEDAYTIGTFNQGKPFVSGFRAGAGGGSGFGAPYVPFNNFSGNMTLGEKVLAIALHDASQGVKEVGVDTGHPRIIQIQALGGAKIGGGTGFAWCGCTVGTWWTEAEGKTALKDSSILASHPNPAYVPTWVEWAIANGRYVDMTNPDNAKYTPKAGDAIVYDWKNDGKGASNHIGIFWKIEGGYWYGVDGNFSGGITSHRLNNLSQVQAVIRI